MIRSIFFTIMSTLFLMSPVHASFQPMELLNSLGKTIQNCSADVGQTCVHASIYAVVLGAVVGLIGKKLVDYGYVKFNVLNEFKVYQPGEVKENFNTIIGFDREKRILSDIINYLKEPEKYKNLGAEPDRGILLTGVPGIGKTMLARALAGEANCAFIYASSAEVDSIYRLQKIFAQAKELQQPCIIFLDEIDLIALDREKYQNSIVVTLLTELDGFVKDQKHPVIVIAATNFPEKLDKAVLRPGRLSKEINMHAPDAIDRTLILEFYLSKIKSDPNIDLSSIVTRTQFNTPAKLAAIVAQAARIAVSKNELSVNLSHLQEAVDIELIGVLAVRQPNEHDRKIAAYHEAGHALVSLLARPERKVIKISIIARGGTAGMTHFASIDENIAMISKDDCLNDIAVGFGGRAAEELIFNLISTGPAGDLKAIAEKIKPMLARYAMGDQLLMQTTEEIKDTKQLTEEAEVILKAQYQRVLGLLKNNFGALHALAGALLEKGELYEDEIYAIFTKTLKA